MTRCSYGEEVKCADFGIVKNGWETFKTTLLFKRNTQDIL